MIIQDVINLIDNLSPLTYAEDFDNVGLLVGDKHQKLTGVLITLDTLEEVVDEAIKEDCNLIVSFHPIIFKGLKSLTGKTYVERTVIKAIKHNIAIFSMHTALDNAFDGVNGIICNQLRLKNKKILIPQENTIKKLQVYVPKENAETLRLALFNAGAGNIGNYYGCSFSLEGTGTFTPNENANPVKGEIHKPQSETEECIMVTFAKHLQSNVLKAMYKHHPYEEVAYELSTLENTNQHIGMGMIGELEQELDEKDALEFIKQKMNTKAIRHSKLLNKSVKNIAVLGGSGSFAISAAKRAKADMLITSDLKYHDFFSAEDQIVLVDIGHYESEQYTKSYLYDYLSKKITSFAIILSKTNTNPVKYL